MSRQLAAIALAVLAVTALAPPLHASEEAIRARKAHMTAFGQNLGMLAGMAQGRAPYDAAQAQAAADTLHALAHGDLPSYWPEGSAQGQAAVETRALPAIWESHDDFLARYAALQGAATAMQAAAGTDLAALQGALGGVAGACQACHQQFRGN